MNEVEKPKPRELEFEPIEEKWNEYELRDQNIYVKLRARIILLKVISDPSSPSRYQMKFQKIFTVSSSKPGPPMKPPNPRELKRLPKYPVEIVSSREPWNIYRITETGDIMRVKLIITDIYRVKNIYDPEGQPYYIIQAGPLITKGKAAPL